MAFALWTSTVLTLMFSCPATSLFADHRVRLPRQFGAAREEPVGNLRRHGRIEIDAAGSDRANGLKKFHRCTLLQDVP